MKSVYTREGFKRKLKKLPPNRAFCKGELCPIATFYLSDKDPETANDQAIDLDPKFTWAIDKISGVSGEWKTITPRIALAVLATLTTLEDSGLVT